jgi:signal transduction histidine kinase
VKQGIWIRIFLALLVVVLPIAGLQLRLQVESIRIVYALAEKTGIHEVMDQYLSQLREEAKKNPSEEVMYRKKFNEVVTNKRALESFFFAKSSLEDSIAYQTLLAVLGVLILALLVAIFIAHGIVKKFDLIIKERERAVAKLKDLASLQNWQTLASVLVHELRAPITPIKFIATDIEQRAERMKFEEFKVYLGKANQLVLEQIRTLEDMINSFTEFGKLPEPALVKVDLVSLLNKFVHEYAAGFGAEVQLAFRGVELRAQILADAVLIRQLLFNLCRNASEENEGKTTVTFSIAEKASEFCLSVHNTGASVPSHLKEKIFEPYVSAKSENGKLNRGLGLAICRKIAFDHQGELVLGGDSPLGGATFILTLPKINLL